jgi:hypothetical protein
MTLFYTIFNGWGLSPGDLELRTFLAVDLVFGARNSRWLTNPLQKDISQEHTDLRGDTNESQWALGRTCGRQAVAKSGQR